MCRSILWCSLHHQYFSFPLVFGWLNGSTFEGREQGQIYELQVGYAKGPITNRLFRYTLETTTTSTPPPGMQCT